MPVWLLLLSSPGIPINAHSFSLAGIKDLPTPSPPPKGFNIFKKCRFPNLESATSMFAEKIVSKVSVTGKGGNPDDDDIEMGNQIISFKCPLTLIRIRVPVRSRKCRHRQCYDCEVWDLSKSIRCMCCSCDIFVGVYQFKPGARE